MSDEDEDDMPFPSDKPKTRKLMRSARKIKSLEPKSRLRPQPVPKGNFSPPVLVNKKTAEPERAPAPADPRPSRDEPPAEDLESEDEEVSTDEGEMILGMPSESWTPNELTYIDERQIEILDQLSASGKKSARPLVTEVIKCDVEMQRLDREIAAKRDKLKKDPARMRVEMRPLVEMRQDFMDRYLEAMKNLGIMPKDCIQSDPSVATLSELHARYLKELNLRREQKWPIGQLGPEAKKLCEEVGAVPEIYQSPRAMNDTARAEFILKPDTEIPVE